MVTVPLQQQRSTALPEESLYDNMCHPVCFRPDFFFYAGNADYFPLNAWFQHPDFILLRRPLKVSLLGEVTEWTQAVARKCRETPMGRTGVVGLRLRIRQLSTPGGISHSELKLYEERTCLWTRVFHYLTSAYGAVRRLFVPVTD